MQKQAQRSSRHICSMVSSRAYDEEGSASVCVCVCVRAKNAASSAVPQIHQTRHTYAIKYAMLLSIISHLDSATVDFG